MDQPDSKPASRWLFSACTAVIAPALLALVGALLNVPMLAGGVFSSLPMAPSTALAIILLAAALHPGHSWSRARRLGLLLPALLLALPSLALFTARFLEVGGRSMADMRPFDVSLWLWTMSPLTGTVILLLAASATAYLRRGRQDSSLPAAWGASLAAAPPAVILLGYLYAVPLFYGGAIIPMAATTAGCLLALAAALIADAGWKFWPWNLFYGDSPRAVMMRSFLPLGVGLILLMGFLDSHLDLAASVLHSTGIIFGTVLFTTWMVSRISARVGASIEATERRLTSSERLNRSLVAHIPQRIFIKDLNSVYLFCNTNYASDLGIMPDKIVGMDDFAFFPRELAEAYRADDRGVMAAGRIKDIVERYMLAGAERWIHTVKVPYRDYSGAIIGVMGLFEDVTERMKAKAELERLRTAIDQTGESIFITDAEGTIQFVNPAFELSTGYRREEAVGKNPRILKSGRQDAAFYRGLWETISSGRIWKGRIINRRKDGSLLTEDATISPMRGTDGRITNYVAVKRDVAESIRLEGELRQSQKMESVGRLAGGVAHDFNNVLTAINGYTGFALAGLAEDDQRRDDLNQVLAASERAARLTRQLLAFSRKQILNPQALDMNVAVGETVTMLKRIIGEDITIVTKLAAYSCMVKLDQGQIEQVFLNLAVNARDAMPKGGTLTFETEIVPLTEKFASRHPGMPLGPLVCMSVRDTGCGMSDDVKSHLFEPFFTTKVKGNGTGLGLSMVYGVVKQSGGDIEVDSAPDQGTTFRIYFPRLDPTSSARGEISEAGRGKAAALGGNETVLFVEDEEVVRRLGARAMAAGGYTVLVAANGQEALKVMAIHGKAVDLLVTDVVMPGLNGRELAQALASKRMVRRTLFISGFTDDAIVRHGVLEPGLAFLYKPFSPDALLRKMRETLDGLADKAMA